MSTDPSYSRTYLTISNNNYQPIHTISNDSSVLAERHRKNERLIGFKSDTAKRGISSLLKVAPSRSPNRDLENGPLNVGRPVPAMASPDEVDDVNRLPESSDEENIEDTRAWLSTDKEREDSKSKAQSSKRPLNNRDINADNARRSKRHKTSDEPLFASTMPEKSLDSAEEDSFMLRAIRSQDSNSRKSAIRKYRSSQSLFSLPSSAAEPKPARTKFKSISREATPVSEARRSQRSEPQLKEISSSPSVPPSNRQRSKSKLIDSSPAEPAPIVHTVFQTVDDPDSDPEPSSRTTSDTSRSAIFDKAKHHRERRGSTSSLSSADSLVEYQLDASQKANLMSDVAGVPGSQTSATPAALPVNHIICPSCRRPTSLLDLPGHNPTTNPNTLSLRKQTKFCYDHRMRDAQLIWNERNYPKIDWNSLATSESLQKHIKDLVPIVRRKSPSHYLSKLDTAISTAKGNQTEVNRVFDITNVHHGYYGPRGAKIISQAILDSEDLQKVLSRQLRNDKNIRIAGLGRLTDCVLLPEVLMRLVQEDLVLGQREEAGEQARKVLEDSVDIGLLLCADDDDVDGGDDEIEEL